MVQDMSEISSAIVISKVNLVDINQNIYRLTSVLRDMFLLINNCSFYLKYLRIGFWKTQ